MLTTVAAAAIFILTYVGIAIGRIPGLRLDRAGIALVGASLMLSSQVLTAEEAYRAINLDTITLLLGMMIVVAHLKLSGFFRVVASFALRHAHSPFILLVAVAITTGSLSAFLVNDAVCVVMTPLVINVTRSLRCNPVPYLLGVAMASNVGSVATLTGNPQNMVIGAISGIAYTSFAAALAPIAMLGLIVVIALIPALSWIEFNRKAQLTAEPPTGPVHKAQMAKTLVVTFAIIASFFVGVPVAQAAILGAATLLVTRAIKAAKIYREIDGSLLLMFASLFVVVAGAEKVLLSPELISMVQSFHLDRVWPLTIVTAALSNTISNVPAVLAIRPFVQGLPDPDHVWLVIAMSSTLAGNLTIVGSVANLIVAERARHAGISISFWAYCRVGIPLTLITLLIGGLWLS